MKKLHEKETEGSKFLIKPVKELENINTVATILTPYYGLTLKHARNTKWKGKEAPIKRLARGLCLGLNHMHDTGIAHRDIKPDNILLQNNEGDPIIIDFGLSNAVDARDGTKKYLAPE
jgi:serine/threonine protein kinase